MLEGSLMRSTFRALALAGSVIAATTGLAPLAVAKPDEPKSPYPDITRYVKQDFEGYRVAGQRGVWFSTPSGLDCGIWEDGSFGCTGAIPDSPAGTNQIGWFTGDNAPHFDNTKQLRFSNEDGEAQRVLPASNYLELGDSKCATTPDGGVFCTRNSYTQFLIVGDKTYINDSWRK